jgi:hypothetical protein
MLPTPPLQPKREGGGRAAQQAGQYCLPTRSLANSNMLQGGCQNCGNKLQALHSLLKSHSLT